MYICEKAKEKKCNRKTCADFAEHEPDEICHDMEFCQEIGCEVKCIPIRDDLLNIDIESLQAHFVNGGTWTAVEFPPDRL